MGKQAPVLFEQLAKALEGGEGQNLVKKIKVKGRWSCLPRLRFCEAWES